MSILLCQSDFLHFTNFTDFAINKNFPIIVTNGISKNSDRARCVDVAVGKCDDRSRHRSA